MGLSKLLQVKPSKIKTKLDIDKCLIKEAKEKRKRKGERRLREELRQGYSVNKELDKETEEDFKNTLLDGIEGRVRKHRSEVLRRKVGKVGVKQ